MVFNAANALFVLPLWLFGKKVLINTDGLEWKRSKWGFFGKNFYKFSEKLACFIATRLVSDSNGIQDYYIKIHNTDSTKIAYGAYVQTTKNKDALKIIRVEANEYFLQITRFEPENNPLMTIRAFKSLNTTKKLVLVGGNHYPNEYTRQISVEMNDNIIMPGFIYDQESLKVLWCHSFAYIHGNDVGGTNPALLQSMASACFIFTKDNPFNREVMKDCGLYYSDEKSLADNMRWALENKEKLHKFKKKAQQRIVEQYSWEKITDQYESLFEDVKEGKYSWCFRKVFNRS